MITWDEKLQTNIESMDDQHKRWIRIMNNLNDGIQNKRDSSVIDLAIMSMKAYTRFHFTDEEKLMLENGYPDFANHKKMHDDFIQQVDRLEKSRKPGEEFDWRMLMDIMSLMSSWLTEHIQKIDQQYSPFLKEKGVR